MRLWVAAYGLILPQADAERPTRGCLNIHAAAAALERRRPHPGGHLSGDAETGITIMQMDAGLDTGPCCLRRSVPITSATSAATYTTNWRLSGRSDPGRARCLASAVPQSAADATYAPKLSRKLAKSTGASLLRKLTVR